ATSPCETVHTAKGGTLRSSAGYWSLDDGSYGWNVSVSPAS
ncbi:hypothetical protein LCGC14_3151710, partial [marine sediment metagenome]